jgi:hypothetical protein
MRIIFIAFCLFVTSCANQQIYESIQGNQKNKCTEEPSPSLQKKCQEKLVPYKDYERLRSEK